MKGKCLFITRFTFLLKLRINIDCIGTFQRGLTAARAFHLKVYCIMHIYSELIANEFFFFFEDQRY